MKNWIRLCLHLRLIGGLYMITEEYISVADSLAASLVGLGIVFLALIFLAIFVTIVSKVIAMLEKNIPADPRTMPTAAVPSAHVKRAEDADAVKIAVIAAAVSEERREPLHSFAITNIKKL